MQCHEGGVIAKILVEQLSRTLDPLLSYFTSYSDVEKYGKVHSIFRLLNYPLTKVWLNFLLNTLTSLMCTFR